DPAVEPPGDRDVPGYADPEVGEVVAVEVARHQRRADPRVGVDGAAPVAFVPDLVAGRGETRGTAVQDVHEARIITERQVFARDADRQVVLAVAVEVAGRQARAEVVATLRSPRDVGTGLVPALTAGPLQAAAGAVQDGHRAGVGRPEGAF